VAEILLDGLGWAVLWHFAGPGRHGVDLVLVPPGDAVVAIEVKGTLVPRRLPRLARRELAQMSAGWVDKGDNPGMHELGVTSGEIYGAVLLVNFADPTWRAGLTSDFVNLFPVQSLNQLTDLAWLANSPDGD